MAELERLLDDSYLGDLEERSLAELRAMRVECHAVETGLSYLRRVAQGRLDIVATEARRRADGSQSGTLDDLIERLPSILSDRTRPSGVGRLPHSMGTGTVDERLAAEIERVLGPGEVGHIGELDEQRLADAAEALSEIERRISDHRHALFDRLDALQAEVARRYRTGEADIESLLR